VKIINLSRHDITYTCNAYFVRGSWNKLADKNTLVDVGREESLLERLEKINSGVGKHRVDQVVITHNHYDHTGLLKEIIARYNPRIYAFSPSVTGVTDVLQGGSELLIGDEVFKVLHCAGHSSDSIFLFNVENGVLFAGDNTLSLQVSGYYEDDYCKALYWLSGQDVKIIYPGHGEPVEDNANTIIRRSYNLCRKVS